MVGSSNEIAIFSCGDFALTANADATWMANNLTHHVLSNLHVPLTNPVIIATTTLTRQDTTTSNAPIEVFVEIRFSSAYWPLCDIVWPNIRSYRSRSFTISEISLHFIIGGFQLLTDSDSKYYYFFDMLY